MWIKGSFGEFFCLFLKKMAFPYSSVRIIFIIRSHKYIPFLPLLSAMQFLYNYKAKPMLFLLLVLHRLCCVALNFSYASSFTSAVSKLLKFLGCVFKLFFLLFTQLVCYGYFSHIVIHLSFCNHYFEFSF